MKAMAVDERNTADTLSRLLTVWQVLWFSVAEIQRAREGLPTTTLELTALSFVVVMIATSVCWFRKPSISTPQIPTKNGKLIYEIRADAKENTHPDLDIEVWYRTPLDFVRDDRWGIDAHWSYYIRISHLLHLKVMSRPVKSRSWDRFPSDQWLPPEKDLIPFGSLVLLLFSSSFLIAWNFYFPTKAEQWLWRGFAIYHSVFVVYGGVYYLIEAIRWRRRRSKGKTGLVIEEEAPEDHSSVRNLVRSATGESDSDPEAQLRGKSLIERFSSTGRLKWYSEAQQWIVSWRNISAWKCHSASLFQSQ